MICQHCRSAHAFDAVVYLDRGVRKTVNACPSCCQYVRANLTALGHDVIGLTDPEPVAS